MCYVYSITSDAICEVSFDRHSGVQIQRKPGVHSIWAARVPFIPSFSSTDFVQHPGEQVHGRISQVVHRQFRFIYDLANAKHNQATFELRFIARPDSEKPDQPAAIDIVFFGKAFHTREDRSKEFATQLWEKFHSNYPLEDPFNYPLQPIKEDQFFDYYEPIDYEGLTHENIAEIRKYEDLPIERGLPYQHEKAIGDYVAHPFMPALDFGAMARFFETLARQRTCCFASISLRPTQLWNEEELYVRQMIGRFRQIASGESLVAKDFVQEGAQLSLEEADQRMTDVAARYEYVRGRAQVGQAVYETMMKEKQHLFLVKIQIVGEDNLPLNLVEALGSELMDNAHNPYPTQWEMIKPEEEDFPSVLHNLQCFEYAPWGQSKAAPQLRRLQHLAGAREACGAFRLPIPPESGYLAGVIVRDEPFVAPSDHLERQQEKQLDRRSSDEASIKLGEIHHRGNPTGRHFSVPVKQLTRHGLFSGSTGSGKTNSLLCILTQLAQLWHEQEVASFLVLYPLDKPDYRKLLATEVVGGELLVFTLGDEGVSPFRFNPFALPKGVLLRTHLSRLLRCFSAAYAMADPLPAIYREALRKVYRDKHWDLIKGRGGDSAQIPNMMDFYNAIVEVTSELEYGREIQADIYQASEIRIRDLLESTGSIINVVDVGQIQAILDRPTVIELGRVGSMEDTALIMGFLMLLVSEHIEQQKRDKPHVMVVEEAHRLMSRGHFGSEFVADPRSQSGEDFSNILAEVRGFNEGILIAEQTPTDLVSGAIGNTYLKVMHWLEDAESFYLFSELMNLDDRQKKYARTLKPGEAIVRSEFGRPVHIVVPEFETEFVPKELLANPNALDRLTTDDCLRELMCKRLKRLGITIPPTPRWDRPTKSGRDPRSAKKQAAPDLALHQAEKVWSITHRAGSLIMQAPFRTCAYCEALHKTQGCLHQKTIRLVVDNSEFHLPNVRAIQKALQIKKLKPRWRELSVIGRRVESICSGVDTEAGRAEAYCYFAHVAEERLQKETGDALVDKQVREDFNSMLFEFDRHYARGDEG